MHGTEIKDGLNMAIMSRNTHIPTSVFVLTDGAVSISYTFKLLVIRFLIQPTIVIRSMIMKSTVYSA